MKPNKTSGMDQLVLLLKENRSDWKHQTAILTLIQRFGDIGKARRPYTCNCLSRTICTSCLENMAIDEIETELMESIRVLLNDK